MYANRHFVLWANSHDDEIVTARAREQNEKKRKHVRDRPQTSSASARQQRTRSLDDANSSASSSNAAAAARNQPTSRAVAMQAIASARVSASTARDRSVSVAAGSRRGVVATFAPARRTREASRASRLVVNAGNVQQVNKDELEKVMEVRLAAPASVASLLRARRDETKLT